MREKQGLKKNLNTFNFNQANGKVRKKMHYLA